MKTAKEISEESGIPFATVRTWIYRQGIKPDAIRYGRRFYSAKTIKRILNRGNK